MTRRTVTSMTKFQVILSSSYHKPNPDIYTGTKKTGAKTAGRVLVPVSELVNRLLALKFQFDVMGKLLSFFPIPTITTIPKAPNASSSSAPTPKPQATSPPPSTHATALTSSAAPTPRSPTPSSQPSPMPPHRPMLPTHPAGTPKTPGSPQRPSLHWMKQYKKPPPPNSTVRISRRAKTRLSRRPRGLQRSLGLTFSGIARRRVAERGGIGTAGTSILLS